MEAVKGKPYVYYQHKDGDMWTEEYHRYKVGLWFNVDYMESLGGYYSKHGKCYEEASLKRPDVVAKMIIILK